MKQFKGFLSEQEEFLTEADTSDATNMEMAICYAYNRWKWSGTEIEERHEDKGHDVAISLAKVGGKYKKFKH